IINDAKPKDIAEGTMRRGAATCPKCGFTTIPTSVKRQMKEVHGGSDTGFLIAVRYDNPKTRQRTFRLANDVDYNGFLAAKEYLEKQKLDPEFNHYMPYEETPKGGGSG